MTTPGIILPQLTVEAGFASAAPVQPPGTFTLDDAVNGVLDTSTLGGGITWTDISAWVQSFSVSRPSTRLQGPLFNFQAGTASILLDNSDGRFDPDNLGGPYVTPAIPPISFGAYLDGSALGTAGWTASLAAWLALTGIPLAVSRWYAGTTYTVGTTLSQMIAAGTRICIDFAPPYSPGSPSDRAAIAVMLAAMKASGADVRVSLWHEPALSGLSAADYTGMIAYYGPTVRQYYPLWAVFSGTDTTEANGYFPGPGNVDGIAADCYATSMVNLDNCAAMADNHALPLGLWEFGAAFDLGIDPSPVTGVSAAAGLAFLSSVQRLFAARAAAGKPCGDVIFFSASGAGSTGTGNFLGPASSQAAGFEGGIANWVNSGNCAIAASATWAHSGTQSLRLTSSAAGNMSARPENIATSTTYALAVTATQQVSASNWWRAGSTPRNVHTDVTFYSAALTNLGTLNGTAVANSASADTFTSCTVTAPATSAWAVAHVQVDATGTANEIHYADDVQICVLPASTDHTAPVQFGWDWRVAALAAMQAALQGRGAIPAVTALTAMTPVRIRAAFLSVAYPLYSGFADGWLPGTVTYEGGYAEITVACTDGQKVLNGITLPPAGPVGAGELAGARVTRVLNAAGWYTGSLQRQVSGGSSAVQAYVGGDTAWNLMQAAADAEIGQLYVDGAGAVTFRARRALLSDSRSNTPQAVFGDLPGTVQAAGTEIPYAAVGRASDDTTIANDVQATRVNGGTLQEVKDNASIAKYKFPRSYARSDLIIADDATTLNWAQWVLYVARSGEDRFESVAVDPQADPVTLWPQVLGRQPGDRIQVWQRPAGATAPITKDCFVAGITHAWDSVTQAWLTTFSLQDASKYGSFLTLNNPTLGQLDRNALAF